MSLDKDLINILGMMCIDEISRRNEKLGLYEIKRNAVVYKEFSLGKSKYIIVKYTNDKRIRYKSKVWMQGTYRHVAIKSNPRQARRTIYKHFEKYKDELE